jgi:hypothetical protein
MRVWWSTVNEAWVSGRHAVALAGLDPGSTYHYRAEGVGDGQLPHRSRG